MSNNVHVWSKKAHKSMTDQYLKSRVTCVFQWDTSRNVLRIREGGRVHKSKWHPSTLKDPERLIMVQNNTLHPPCWMLSYHYYFWKPAYDVLGLRMAQLSSSFNLWLFIRATLLSLSLSLSLASSLCFKIETAALLVARDNDAMKWSKTSSSSILIWMIWESHYNHTQLSKYNTWY